MSATVISVTQLNDASVELLMSDGSHAIAREFVQIDSNGNIIDDLAAGAVTIADGASTTLGHKADAADAHTDTTAITEMSVLKQVSKSVQDIDTGGAGFSATNITGTTTTTVKASAGRLRAIIINTPVATSVITYKDGATVLGTITLPGTLLNDGPIAVPLDIACATSIVVVTGTAGSDITVIWR